LTLAELAKIVRPDIANSTFAELVDPPVQFGNPPAVVVTRSW
jgi:hypothetical protein